MGYAQSIEQYKFICEETYSKLEDQARTLDELRNRSALTAAAIGIPSSFLATRDFSIRVPLILLVMATLVFSIGICSLVFVMKPAPNWAFHLRSEVLLRGWIEAKPEMTDSEFYMNLALHLEEDFDANRLRMKPFWRAFQVGLWVSLASIANWLILLIIYS